MSALSCLSHLLSTGPPALWNSLPSHLRKQPIVNDFKISYKRNILNILPYTMFLCILLVCLCYLYIVQKSHHCVAYKCTLYKNK